MLYSILHEFIATHDPPMRIVQFCVLSSTCHRCKGTVCAQAYVHARYGTACGLSVCDTAYVFQSSTASVHKVCSGVLARSILLLPAHLPLCLSPAAISHVAEVDRTGVGGHRHCGNSSSVKDPCFFFSDADGPGFACFFFGKAE